MQIKLHTNADWYPTDQAKLAYFTSRLRGRAMDQVAFGVTVGNTGVQLTVGRYNVLVDVGCGLGS
jgi:hypothetical protein